MPTAATAPRPDPATRRASTTWRACCATPATTSAAHLPGRRGERGGDRRQVVLRQWSPRPAPETRPGRDGRAHLDSVPDGPGINDNGSGVAALLEIATRLGGSPQIVNAVRFGFWGSEEANLNGSTTTSRRCRPPTVTTSCCTSTSTCWRPRTPAISSRAGRRRPSQTGPPGSAEVAQVLVDELAANGVAAEATTFDEHRTTPVRRRRHPVGRSPRRGRDDKSAAEARTWGGRAGKAFDRCYHSACDRLDNIDRTALDRFTHAVAGTVAHFTVDRPAPVTRSGAAVTRPRCPGPLARRPGPRPAVRPRQQGTCGPPGGRRTRATAPPPAGLGTHRRTAL